MLGFVQNNLRIHQHCPMHRIGRKGLTEIKERRKETKGMEEVERLTIILCHGIKQADSKEATRVIVRWGYDGTEDRVNENSALDGHTVQWSHCQQVILWPERTCIMCECNSERKGVFAITSSPPLLHADSASSSSSFSSSSHSCLKHGTCMYVYTVCTHAVVRVMKHSNETFISKQRIG